MPEPAPTELLAGNVEDLRESLRQVTIETKGVSTAVAVLQTELEFCRYARSLPRSWWVL
jgi:hypothetical protein